MKKETLTNFLKAIVVGIGGVAPGLSGSILLVIFGLYEKTVEAIGTVFKELKKKLIFLIPIFLGIGIGTILFSKVMDYLLVNHEMLTRFTFLGLVLGTMPLLNKEVRKKGFAKKYYLYMFGGLVVGILLFFNGRLFPTLESANIVQSFFLGFAVAASTIMPGVDGAATLSALGLYEIYVSSLAKMDFSVLLPAGAGLGLGILIIAYVMNKLIKKYYTSTFSIIFGLFLAIIPTVLNESCKLAFNFQTVLACLLLLAGAAISYSLGKIKKQ